MIVLAIVIAFGVSGVLSQSNGCLQCICGGVIWNGERNKIESSDGSPGCGSVNHLTCNGMSGCVWDVNSCSCGPYQIKDPYFTDCSEFHSVPINDWYGCATNQACATQCVENYMDRYGTYCTGKNPSLITCEEFGGIHNGGPTGCDSSATAGYREKVTECCTQTSC